MTEARTRSQVEVTLLFRTKSSSLKLNYSSKTSSKNQNNSPVTGFSIISGPSNSQIYTYIPSTCGNGWLITNIECNPPATVILNNNPCKCANNEAFDGIQCNQCSRLIDNCMTCSDTNTCT